MGKLPSLGLWVKSVKTGKEVSIAKVLESGGVIRQYIGLARDVRGFGAVAVVALVGAMEAAEVGAGIGASDGAFAKSGGGRDVVDEVGNGSLTDVV